MGYNTELIGVYKNKLNAVLSNLPPYIKTYLDGRENSITIKTQYAYAKDLKFFLEYMKKANPIYKEIETENIPIEMFEELTAHDIVDFLKEIEYYVTDTGTRHNGKESKQRKLATLRAFYKYCNITGMIKNNPTLAVENIKLEHKDIVAMNTDEVKDFLSVIRNGAGMTGKQLEIQKKNVDRDIALYTLLLGTGIRISEMVGINVNEVDLKHKEFRVVRKGGDEQIIHFGEDVCETLEYYINNVRPKYLTPDSEQKALFLSLKGKRLSVRRIEEMTKTYASIALPAKRITPHKMRSTFGSYIYNETGDAGLVADMLGHSSVDITMKRYAKLDSRRKEAAAEIASGLWNKQGG